MPSPHDLPFSLHLEHEIPPATQAGIAELLEACFPGFFEGRTYCKQLPHFRLLVREAQGGVVAQAGIDSRIVRVGETVLPVFGVIDLCVQPSQQGRGIATRLLAEVEASARRHGREFLILMADRHDLYLRAGFHRVDPAPTTWLGIDERKSLGLLHRDLSDCFMVKPLSAHPWPAGEIDMLGYLF